MNFCIDSPTEMLLFRIKTECKKYVVKNFTHLDKTDEDIFAFNARHSTFNALFMNNLCLERFEIWKAISDGWMMLCLPSSPYC